MPVYQYEGKHYELPDGLSPDEAKGKIQGHLFKSKGEEDLSPIGQHLKNAVGGIDAAATMAAGLPSMIGGGLLGLGKLASGQGIDAAGQAVRDTQESNFGFGAPKPFTKAGGEVSDMIEHGSSALREGAGELAVKAGGGELGRTNAEVATDIILNFLPIPGYKGVQKLARPFEKAPSSSVRGGPSLEEKLLAENRDVPPAPVQPTPRGTIAVDGSGTARLGTENPGLVEAVRRAEGVGPQLETRRPGAQGELFNQADTTGHASPYDAGTVGTTEPIQPRRAAAQMEMPMDPQGPIGVDSAGVARLGNENPGLVAGVEAAKPPRPEMQGPQGELFGNPELLDLKNEGEMAPRPELKQEGTQADLFEPQTNMHRDYTDQRTQVDQPMSFSEFSQTVDNLAAQEGTRFQKPEDMRGAYQDYVTKLNEKQTDMFDIGSRKEAFAEGVRQDNIPNATEFHPFVQKAIERVTKQEELVTKLSGEVEAGKKPATMLARAVKDLENFEHALDKTRENVKKGLGEKNTPLPFNFRKQGGAINWGAVKEGIDQLKRGEIASWDYLKRWEGAFDKRALGEAISDLKDPKSRSTMVLMSPAEFHRLASPRNEAWAKEDAPRLHENIRKGLSSEAGLREIPQLWITTKDGIGQVEGHEGRHRMDVFGHNNVQQVPVIIRDSMIRWGEADPASLPKVMRPQDVRFSKAFDRPFPERVGEKTSDGTIRSPGNRQTGAIRIGGEKKNEAGILNNIPGIKKAIGEIVPEKLTPEQWKEEYKNAPDVNQNIFQKAMNVMTKGGLYQAIKTDNPLVKYTYDRMKEADNKTRADVEHYVHDKNYGLAPALRELKGPELSKAWELVDTADRLQAGVSHDFLKREGYTDKQIRAIETHRSAMNYAFDQYNRARTAIGMEPIDRRVAYAAMRSTGDYRKTVYKDVNGEKTVVGVVTSDYPALLHFRVKELLKKNPEFSVDETAKYFGGVPRERGSAISAFQHAMEMLAKNDPHVKDLLETLDVIYKKESNEFMGMSTHAMDKKGVFGMEGRKQDGKWSKMPWEDMAEKNAKEGFRQQLQYLEGAIKFGHIVEGATDVKKLLKDPEINMPQAKEWSEAYLQNAMGLNPSQLGRAAETLAATVFDATHIAGYGVARDTVALARKAANTVLLGLNPAFWLTNIVQPLAAMPAMKAWLEYRGLKTDFDFGTGYASLFQGGLTTMKAKAMPHKLDAFEKAAVEYAKANHVFGSDLIEHSNYVSKSLGYLTEKVGSKGASEIESVTRRTMFYTFAHILKDNGMSVKNGLFEGAHNLTDMAMNNYSASERAPIYNALGPIGDMAANLSSYKHNEASRLALFAREAMDNPTSAKAYRPVLTQLLTTVAFAGLSGTMFYAEADAIIRAISKMMGSPTSLSKITLDFSEKTGAYAGAKDEGKHVVSKGLPALMGLDMSARLGVGNMVGDNISDVVFPGVSKLGDIAGAGIDFAKDPSALNAKRVAREAAPGFATGPMDRAWFSTDTPKGELAHKREAPFSGTVIRNDADKMAKNFGLTGVHENVTKQRLYDAESTQKAYADLRKPLLAKASGQLYSREALDPELVQKYLKYEGSAETLISDIQKMVKEQHMSAVDAARLNASMSTSMANIRKLQRLQGVN